MEIKITLTAVEFQELGKFLTSLLKTDISKHTRRGPIVFAALSRLLNTLKKLGFQPN